MPSTSERLQAYYDAEARILKAQASGAGNRRVQNAELAEVRRGIRELKAQQQREQSGSGGFSLADFSGADQ